MSSYQLYRNTTLGHTLQESLDELIQMGQITPQLALKVLLQFDKAINLALANRVKNRITFKGKLNTYRFCDNVWTFVLNNAEFKDVQEIAKVDKVKIVACDGKGAEKWLANIVQWERFLETHDLNFKAIGLSANKETNLNDIMLFMFKTQHKFEILSLY